MKSYGRRSVGQLWTKLDSNEVFLVTRLYNEALATIAVLRPTGAENESMIKVKIERSDKRFAIRLPMKLTATDVNGETLEQEVMTVDVSRCGANLSGVHSKLRAGSRVTLGRSQKVEQFLIAWVGGENTPRAGHIGVTAVDSATSFWKDVIEEKAESELAA